MSPVARWLLIGLCFCLTAFGAWLFVDVACGVFLGEFHTASHEIRAWSTPARIAVVCLLAGAVAGGGLVGLAWHLWG